MTALATVNSAQPAVQEAPPIVSMIERIMTDPQVSVERVNQAFDFYQRVNADDARKAFEAAMAAAKAEIPPIFKNRSVDFTSAKGRTNYRHEDMSQIARTVDPILAKHGLSYRFRTKADTAKVEVTCIISHRDGHFEENTLPAPHDNSGNKNSIQAIGSAVTYLQRYTLKAALGLSASEDDDGKAAGQAADELATISEDQQKELSALLAETNTDPRKFLDYAKAEALWDILVKDFDKLKKTLIAKREKR